MNKKNWIIIIIIVALLIGAGIFFYFKNTSSSSPENNYEANRTSADNASNQTGKNNENTQPPSNASPENEVKQGITESEQASSPKVEEQIATFTTKIYSKDSSRQNNITITCNTLNGTMVKNGETFSFCGTVGQSSTSKGYQKADIFDKDGNKKKGLGGRKLSD